jgi:L-ascorbate metabolism protein UlaG (beta-lactamase superfamily)
VFPQVQLPALFTAWTRLTAAAVEQAKTRSAAPLKLELPASDEEPECPPDQGSIFFVGTATVIIRYGGFTILTDPNFMHKGDHAHLGYGLKSRRLTEPAIGIEQLPPIDFVVLSHYLGGHFDQVAQDRLDRNTPIVTTPHAADKLTKQGFTATHALRTWQTLEITKGLARLRLTSMPGRHGPPIVAKALPPVMGSMIEFLGVPNAPDYRLYISGDTVVFDDLREIPQRYHRIDLALVHLGGARVFGLQVTMDAKQGIRALRLIQPLTAIPIHYNDYPVFKSALQDFLQEVQLAGLAKKLRVLKHGETYEFGPGRS